MVQVCRDRLGGSRRRVQKHEGVWMPVAKRFLHPCLHNRSIEPGTRACICVVCLSWTGSPSMMTGGSGTEFRSGKEFGVAGLIMETCVKCWNSNSMGARGYIKKGLELAPMGSFNIEQGGCQLQT